ncbi:uncharacterized protein LOC135226842 isoform X2 [Macrobrachium nipponense]|uniref:uncharacterized protein LOC135226842 isoform X2 n=1 Tax=Macrobrachium nipponense TaxID=159736 RepID=UPI0030C8BA09
MNFKTGSDQLTNDQSYEPSQDGYNFKFVVREGENSEINDHSFQEEGREDDSKYGESSQLDGRFQTVRFYLDAESSSYVAEISYEGEPFQRRDLGEAANDISVLSGEFK